MFCLYHSNYFTPIDFCICSNGHHICPELFTEIMFKKFFGRLNCSVCDVPFNIDLIEKSYYDNLLNLLDYKLRESENIISRYTQIADDITQKYLALKKQ